MDEVAAQVEQRKARVEAATRARLQAEQTLEIATAAVDEAARLLREEFGVTPEEAPALQARLEAEVRDELAAADRILAEAGL